MQIFTGSMIFYISVYPASKTGTLKNLASKLVLKVGSWVSCKAMFLISNKLKLRPIEFWQVLDNVVTRKFY